MNRLIYILLFVTGLLSSALAGDAIEANGIEEFNVVVKPFLTQHCFDCHGDFDGEAGIDLSALSSTIITADQATGWLSVLDQLQADLMPPLDESRPDSQNRAKAIGWIENAVLKSGHAEAYRRKMLLPAYGNYVDHDSLFNGSITAKAFTPARLWRTSPYIFEGIRSVGKIKGIQNPYTYSTPATGLRDYAYSSAVGASVVETIALNADVEIEFQFAQAELESGKAQSSKRRPNPFVPFLQEGDEISGEQMSSIISSTFSRLVSRPPTEAELTKYVDFLKKNLEEASDPRRSLKATLTAIYLSPESIFRMEWGLGETDEHGRRKLSPKETAYALSYALFDTGPSTGGRAENQKMIAKALAAGELESPGDVAAVVREILATEQYKPIGGQAKNAVPRVMRFFHEFFGYDRAVDVFKDQRRVNEHGLYHNPRRLVGDADDLIKVILREDENVFERMLTTNEALVFHNGDNQAQIDRHERRIAELESYDEEKVQKEIEKRKAGTLEKPKYKANPKLVPATFAAIERDGLTLLAKKKAELANLKKTGVSLGSVKRRDYRYIRAYNLNTRNWKWPAAQPFELPKDQRAGILTHPAWLVAHSVNDGNHPIHRGIWVYEKLLAGVIADVPPDVDARVPEDVHMTLRARLGVVRDTACWKCHVKINPLGEPFEMFDDFGRFRTKHYFDENQELITRTANHELDDKGKEVVRGFDRDILVAEGKFTTQPVNATGTFDKLGIAELNGEFNGAVEMIHAIAKTDRARQSIIRHLFRYFLGRNEMLSDSKTLIDADQAYVESGGSFKAVVVSLLSSDSFLYRR